MSLAPLEDRRMFFPHSQTPCANKNTDDAWNKIKANIKTSPGSSKTIKNYTKHFLSRHDTNGCLLVQPLAQEEHSLIAYLQRKTPTTQGHRYKKVPLNTLFPPFLRDELIACYGNDRPRHRIEDILLDGDTTFLEVYRTCLATRSTIPKNYRTLFRKNICIFQENIVNQIHALIHSPENDESTEGSNTPPRLRHRINEDRMDKLSKVWLRCNNLRVALAAEEIKESLAHFELLSQCTYKQALPILEKINLATTQQNVRFLIDIENRVQNITEILNSKEWKQINQVLCQEIKKIDFYNIVHFDEYCQDRTEDTYISTKPLFSERKIETWRTLFDNVRINDLSLIAFRLRTQTKNKPFKLLKVLTDFAPLLEQCQGMLLSRMMNHLNTLLTSAPHTYFEMIEPLPFDIFNKTLEETNVGKAVKMLSHFPLKIEMIDKCPFPTAINNAIEFINYFDNSVLIEMMGTVTSESLSPFLENPENRSVSPFELEQAMTSMSMTLEVIKLLKITRTLTELQHFPLAVRVKLIENHYLPLKSLYENRDIDGVKQAKDEIEKMFTASEASKNIEESFDFAYKIQSRSM